MGNLLSEITTDSRSGGALFASLPLRALLLDKAGIVMAVTTEWRHHTIHDGVTSRAIDVGMDYLAICRRETLEGCEGAQEVLTGLGNVLSGERPMSVVDRPVALATKNGTWRIQILALPLLGDVSNVVVIHVDGSGQKHPATQMLEPENRFHGLVEASNLAYVMIDPLGDVLDINDSYLFLTGRRVRKEIVGRHLLEWILPADRQRAQDAIITCLSTGHTQRIEVEYCRGSSDTVVVGMNVMKMTAHGTPRLMAFCFDLTEQRRAARARRQHEDRYRSVVESQTELVCRYLPDTTLTFVNEAYCRFFKMTREELVGRRFMEFLPVSARGDALASIARTIDGKQPLIYEHEVTAPDGEIHWQEWVDIPIYDNSGRLVELQGIGRDITQQHKAEEDLKLSHRHVHDLASRLMRAQETERRTIARELHDDLSQRLAAHAIALSNLKRRMTDLPDAVDQRLTALESEAMALGDSVRQLSHQLHPAVLEQLGLPAALRSFCAEAGERSQLIFHVDAKDPGYVMAGQVALALYRVAQETIRNIERHAQARNVWVRLSFDELNASMEIRDDGIGFDARGSKKTAGLGLISVEERVRFLNGRLAIESRAGAGTTVHVYIPQSKDRNEAPAHNPR